MYFKMLLIVFFFSGILSAQQLIVKVSVETDIYNYAQEILAGKTPFELENFFGSNAQRDVIEFILIQKALSLGGINFKFDFITGNYDARNPKLLQEGLLLINFDSMWLSHAKKIEKDVYISYPVIRKGEYWAGVYTSKENVDKLKVNSIEDFKRLYVFSNFDVKSECFCHVFL